MEQALEVQRGLKNNREKIRKNQHPNEGVEKGNGCFAPERH